MARSKAIEYVQSKGWDYHVSGDQLNLEACPLCHKGGFDHFYIGTEGPRDGVWICHKCGESGSLRRLQEEMHDAVEGMTSAKEMAGHKEREAMPDIERMHKTLLDNTEALAYLEDIRGLSLDIIKRQKLGLCKRWFKNIGEVRAIAIPYMVDNQAVWIKFRTLPPHREFDNLHGWDAPLFNGQILKPGLDEVVFVEGEMDALSLMSKGYDKVVAVPGANHAKADWINKLDEINPERRYLLYDQDAVGKKAAYKMALRVGIEKALKLTLPEFTFEDPLTGEEKRGKDINDWFNAGHTLEEFEQLKHSAGRFDLENVMTVESALQELLDDIERNGGRMMAEFLTPWPSFTVKFGGADRGDLICLLAEEKRGKTKLAAQWGDYWVGVQEKNVGFFCLEMPEKKLARAWMSLVTETDDTPAVTDEAARKKAELFKVAIPKAMQIARDRKADYLFSSPKITNVEDMFVFIRNAIRRYGLDVVVFDNLQLFADLTLRNQSFRTPHISQIGKMFKQLATDMNVLVLLIVQPNRVKDGNIVDANNADGSSQIQKDCDGMATMHRTMKVNIKASDFETLGFIDEDVSFEPQTLLRMSRTRYGPGGMTTLWFRGEISKFEEFSEGQKQQALASQPQVNNGAIPTEKVDI